jgi:3-isopropylmalate/(R)-2-methylmalate dehydratase small subunit
MKISGVAWCLGDNVSTDEILPGRYIGLEEGPELGSHALEGISPAISSSMSRGDVLIGGHNFGTGSSRESAPKALRSAGFSAVVAESFARIFYRNCINIGLVALWCEGVTEAVNEGDSVVIDLLDSRLLVEATKVSLPLLPLSPFAHQIVDSGGLVPYAKSRLGRSLVSDSEHWGSA